MWCEENTIPRDLLSVCICMKVKVFLVRAVMHPTLKLRLPPSIKQTLVLTQDLFVRVPTLGSNKHSAWKDQYECIWYGAVKPLLMIVCVTPCKWLSLACFLHLTDFYQHFHGSYTWTFPWKSFLFVIAKFHGIAITHNPQEYFLQHFHWKV